MLRDVGIGGLQWPVLKFDNVAAALERARENFAIARRAAMTSLLHETIGTNT